jgi:RNA polymerase sigma-70 factor (ECF subfamily)
VSAVAPQPAETAGLLYERYSGRIYGFCLSLLGSREEAEDAVQTTFLNAQRGLGRGVVPEFELAWLFKIARNVCNNRRVSAWRRGRVESARDLDLLQDSLAGPERSAEVSIGELTRALAGVPERQRRALLLREWQGLSYSEIAAELGVSVAAVETLLFRARRSMAEQLEQAGTKRRRGVAASVVELFRWLFTGGAAPVKIAGATAVVATTAAFAVVPAVHRNSSPVSPPSDTRIAPDVTRSNATPGPAAHARTPKARPGQSAVKQNVGAPREATPPTTITLPSSPPARSTVPQTGGTGGTGETGATAGGSSAPPPVQVPAVATPDLPTQPLPEISLPQVEVPPLQLPSTSQLPSTAQLPTLQPPTLP